MARVLFSEEDDSFQNLVKRLFPSSDDENGPLFVLKKLFYHSSNDEEDRAYHALDKAIRGLVRQKNYYEYEVDIQFRDGPSETYWDWVGMVRNIEAKARELRENLKIWGKLPWYPLVHRLFIVKEMEKLHIEVERLRNRQPEGRLLVDFKLHPPNIKKFATLQKPLEQILSLLNNNKVYKIGIHGPFGIGKTTIMGNLCNHEKVAELFDIVIWVKASREGNKENFSIECIQQGICQRLKLWYSMMSDKNAGDALKKTILPQKNKAILEQYGGGLGETLSASRERLEETLSASEYELKEIISALLVNKKYLLLIDNVKEAPDLERMGIPADNKKNGSKVILTTRLRQICSGTGDKLIRVSYLSPDEAWNMFLDAMHYSVSREPSLKYCEWCGGLPRLIKEVASALPKGFNSRCEWYYRLNDWKLWPKESRQGIEEVYNSLKFFYDELLDDSQKRCFVYVALYPEGSHIYSEHLLECWIAEGLLGDSYGTINMWSLMSAQKVLDHLKDVSLLDDGKTKDHVTMPNFIRQVALNILEGERLAQWVPRIALFRHSEWISSADSYWFDFQRRNYNRHQVSTLFLQQNLEFLEIPEEYFQDMGNLRVLDLSDTRIMSLSSSLKCLVRLQILYLNNCNYLESLPEDIIYLHNLESLDLRGSGVANIPHNIGGLNNLRRLRVSFVKNADAAPEEHFDHNIISELFQLQELVIDVIAPDNQCFNELVGSIMNAVATLMSFNTLKFIFSDKVVHAIDATNETLHVHTPDSCILESFIKRSRWRNVQSIESFQFFIGSESAKHPALACFGKYLKYCGGEGSIFPVEILSEADAFELVNHKDIEQLSYIEIESMNNLRACLVEKCDAFVTILNATNEAVLPNLEQLYLKNLPKLKSICEGSLPPGSLTKIKTLALIGCHRLTKIFPSAVIEQLREIEHLVVQDCPMVEELFSHPVSPDVLPKLRKLKLLGLPKLKEICEARGLNWPSLEKLKVSRCPELRNFPLGEANETKLRVIKAEQVWWDSIQWPNKEMKEQLQIICNLRESWEHKSNSSQEGEVHEHPEYQLEEENLIFEDWPQMSKAHEHSVHQWEGEHRILRDLGFQDTATSYNYQDEGCSTEPSRIHEKEDSIPGTSLEAEEERVTEQELDLVETTSSKVFDGHTLDWSYKSISSLPEDMSKYVAARELKLKGCQLLMELRPEIGELTNLELLDVEGTELICLPKEIAKLINLRSLKFSLCGYADQFQETKQIGSIIPQKVLSNLIQLNELSIDVIPLGDWWSTEVKTVMEDLHYLQNLRTLRLYIPTVELFKYLIRHSESLIYQASVRFRFTVGYYEQRLVSRLPQEVLDEFDDLEKFKKGLKFTDGEGMPLEIMDALEHVDAFLLERHWSINNVLEFGQKSTDKLKCCILLECNELRTVIDTKRHKDFDGTILGSLQHLSIHYMKSMQKIWRGPVRKGSLSNLKSLALHTCVSLTTIFKLDMLAYLTNLEELRIEDCPKISTLVSSNSPDSTSQFFLPKLKSMLLLELPNMRCISSGLSIAPKLERLVIFYCPKLYKLCTVEISSRDLKVFKGDKGWWDALKWYESDVSEADQNYLTSKFIPVREDGDLDEQFLRE